MLDEEKYNFLLEKGSEFSGLLELYIFELAINQEFEKIKKLYSELSEKHLDFTHLHFLMGVIHIPIDPALAKSCFEKTLEIAEKDEAAPETILQSLRLNISFLEGHLSEQIEAAEETEEAKEARATEIVIFNQSGPARCGRPFPKNAMIRRSRKVDCSNLDK
jgi:hypothetical protein